MKNKLYKIFKKKNDIVIGVIHFPPLLGYPGFPGFDTAIKNALNDLKAFEKGGVNGIIFENNYDIPHKELVAPSIIASMTFLGEKIKEKTKLPLGINVLWNDYYSALSIAKTLNAKFIRIPVFVDKVKTECGVIKGQPEKVLEFRKSINAENVALLTDMHVKHSMLLSQKNIIVSAKRAIKNYSDAIIITGKWTGQPPDIEELKKIRKAIGNFPILTGSGANENNIKELLKYANGIIVSTSLKKGENKKREINVKSYSQRIDETKVKNLIKTLNKITNLKP